MNSWRITKMKCLHLQIFSCCEVTVCPITNFTPPPQQDSAAFLEKTDFKALWQWHAEAMFGAATSQHDGWSVRICFCVWQRLLPQPFCMHVALSCIGSLTGQYVLSPERCGGAPSSNCASNLSALLTSLFVHVSSHLLFFFPPLRSQPVKADDPPY